MSVYNDNETDTTGTGTGGRGSGRWVVVLRTETYILSYFCPACADAGWVGRNGEWNGNEKASIIRE